MNSYNTNWKSVISEDIKRWAKFCREPLTKKFVIKTFLGCEEFRRLIHYRIQHTPLRILRPITKLLSDKINLYIWTKEIGPGFKIEHGFSTIILANRIGKNFTIFQQVTIGWGGKTDDDGNHAATIGDDVTVHPGAKIFGGVHIGNDVEIGANSVVLHDVPDHCIVAGVPAKIIKRRSSRNEPWQKVENTMVTVF